MIHADKLKTYDSLNQISIEIAYNQVLSEIESIIREAFERSSVAGHYISKNELLGEVIQRGLVTIIERNDKYREKLLQIMDEYGYKLDYHSVYGYRVFIK